MKSQENNQKNNENKNSKNIELYGEFVGGRQDSAKDDLISDELAKNKTYTFRYNNDEQDQISAEEETENLRESEENIETEFSSNQDESENKRELKKVRLRRKKRKLFRKFLIFILLCVLVFFAMKLSYFKISQISVSGNEEISKETVIKDSKIKIGDNVFFFGKSEALKEMEKNPLYKEVEISRKLPNEIEINIKERKGKIVLAYGEKYVLIDEEGTVIKLLKEKPKLSEIESITIKNMDRAETLEAKEKESFEKALDIFKESEKADLFFQYIEVGKEVKLTVYGNLYIKGKYKYVLENIKNGKMKKILEDVYKKDITRGTIKIDSDKDMSFTPIFE